MRVLVVEDDRKLGPVLVRGLATDAIVADLVTTGEQAIVREEKANAPVLMLTARDESRTASTSSTAARTTTWSSRSRSTSCWPACAP